MATHTDFNLANYKGDTPADLTKVKLMLSEFYPAEVIEASLILHPHQGPLGDPLNMLPQVAIRGEDISMENYWRANRLLGRPAVCLACCVTQTHWELCLAVGTYAPEDCGCDRTKVED